MDRVGEEILDKYGNHSKIIKYNSYKDIIVEFDDSTQLNGRYDVFKRGGLIHPFERTFYNKGYMGVGKYNTKDMVYRYWHSMIKRVYDPIEHNRYPNYIGCSVCEEWHDLQNFGKWYEDNYYEINGELMCLDKDILNKGNKIYSPETCIFVPNRINVLFTNCKKARGKYPLGVIKTKDGKYRARCSVYYKEANKSKNIGLGRFNTPEEAFYAYKEFKEQYIKEVADEYKDKIPKKLYDAMYNYKVDIND